jgi:hypothetical protein
MRLSISHRRMNGAGVKLVFTIAPDGAIESWRCEDPITGAHVDLSTGDAFYAVSVMHQATERMQRGAA